MLCITILNLIMSEIKVNKSGQHCCVPFCKSDSRYNPDIHFHHIPKKEDIRKQWIIKIRRDEGSSFHISSSTVVCSKHFKEDDYTGWSPVRKKLKSDAVPSNFDWTSPKTPRRLLKRTISSASFNSFEKDEGQDTTIEPDDEDNFAPTQTEGSEKEMQQVKILKLEKLLEEKDKEIEDLKQQLRMEKFGVTRFSYDDSSMKFFTGFTYISFINFFKCIEPTAQNMQSAYYQSSETISLAGRKRGMLLIDELFLFLCRLHLGLLEQDLSVRFNCSIQTVSRKLVTWVNFLYFTLGSIPIWLSKSKINNLMPECFKATYPNTRVIIDCTEIETQQPSSLVLNSQMYSNYKGTNTFKCLLGIAPHGAVTFISPLYTGCISDVEITKLSGLLDLLEPGDDVMADKGFTIKKVLAEKGVTLNIPAFLRSKCQFSVDEINQTEEIARLRIHIERMNKRIKENHLFDNPLPMSLAGSANQLWAVACMLANFQGPLVKAWAKTT